MDFLLPTQEKNHWWVWLHTVCAASWALKSASNPKNLVYLLIKILGKFFWTDEGEKKLELVTLKTTKPITNRPNESSRKLVSKSWIYIYYCRLVVPNPKRPSLDSQDQPCGSFATLNSQVVLCFGLFKSDFLSPIKIMNSKYLFQIWGEWEWRYTILKLFSQGEKLPFNFSDPCY